MRLHAGLLALVRYVNAVAPLVPPAAVDAVDAGATSPAASRGRHPTRPRASLPSARLAASRRARRPTGRPGATKPALAR